MCIWGELFKSRSGGNAKSEVLRQGIAIKDEDHRKHYLDEIHSHSSLIDNSQHPQIKQITPANNFNNVVVRPDNRIAFSRDNRTMIADEIESAEFLQKIKTTSRIIGLMLLGHNYLVSFHWNKEVKIWDTGEAISEKGMQMNEGWESFAPLTDDRFAIFSKCHSQKIKIFNAVTGECLQTIQSHKGSTQLTTLSDGRLACSGYGKITILNSKERTWL